MAIPREEILEAAKFLRETETMALQRVLEASTETLGNTTIEIMTIHMARLVAPASHVTILVVKINGETHEIRTEGDTPRESLVVNKIAEAIHRQCCNYKGEPRLD